MCITPMFVHISEKIENASDLAGSKQLKTTITVLFGAGKFLRKAKAARAKKMKAESFRFGAKAKSPKADQFSKISSWRVRGKGANKGRAAKDVVTERKSSITTLVISKRRKSFIEMSVQDKTTAKKVEANEDATKSYWSKQSKEGEANKLQCGDKCRVKAGRFAGQSGEVVFPKDSDGQCKIFLNANKDEPFFINYIYLEQGKLPFVSDNSTV